MKSIDHISLTRVGTASGAGTARTSRFFGVQLQFAIDTAHPFVVPGKALHIAQEKVAEAKSPTLRRVGTGQPKELVGDLGILVR